jgi:hypothetical protein
VHVSQRDYDRVSVCAQSWLVTLKDRAIVTADVTVSKIFPAGFGWQTASVYAGAAGFAPTSVEFALMTGTGKGPAHPPTHPNPLWARPHASLRQPRARKRTRAPCTCTGTHTCMHPARARAHTHKHIHAHQRSRARSLRPCVLRAGLWCRENPSGDALGVAVGHSVFSFIKKSFGVKGIDMVKEVGGSRVGPVCLLHVCVRGEKGG